MSHFKNENGGGDLSALKKRIIELAANYKEIRSSIATITPYEPARFRVLTLITACFEQYTQVELICWGSNPTNAIPANIVVQTFNKQYPSLDWAQTSVDLNRFPDGISQNLANSLVGQPSRLGIATGRDTDFDKYGSMPIEMYTGTNVPSYAAVAMTQAGALMLTAAFSIANNYDVVALSLRARGTELIAKELTVVISVWKKCGMALNGITIAIARLGADNTTPITDALANSIYNAVSAVILRVLSAQKYPVAGIAFNMSRAVPNGFIGIQGM